MQINKLLLPKNNLGRGDLKALGHGDPNCLGHGDPNCLGHSNPNCLGRGAPKCLGHGDPNFLGCGDPYCLGCIDPNFLGRGNPNCLGRGDPNFLGCVDPNFLTQKIWVGRVCTQNFWVIFDYIFFWVVLTQKFLQCKKDEVNYAKSNTITLALDTPLTLPSVLFSIKSRKIASKLKAEAKT